MINGYRNAMTNAISVGSTKIGNIVSLILHGAPSLKSHDNSHPSGKETGEEVPLRSPMSSPVLKVLFGHGLFTFPACLHIIHNSLPLFPALGIL